MRASRLVITGAVLPLLLGASLGGFTAPDGRGTWAYPMPPTAFLVLSLGLAVSHLFVMVGYVEIVGRSRAGGARFAALAGLGTALVAGCEVWSGLMARTDLDAPVLTVLDTCYAATAVLILVGTLGAGLALRRSSSPVATPLLLNGLLLLGALPVRYLAGDGWGIAALTVWSLSYVWLGLRLSARSQSPSSTLEQTHPRPSNH